MRSDLPTGTVTFLFTDVEGSTRLLEEIGDEAYDEALSEHRRVLRAVCVAEGGVEVDTQGDAFFFAFPSAPGALAAATEMTEALASGPIQVRIGLHTGRPRLSDEGYVGKEVHFAARVAATGHGGQIVLSKATAELVDASLVELGEHRLKDIPEPVSIFQLGAESFPPLKTISNTNLPRPASSFVGRERELVEVLGQIEQGARLLTLTGPGGSGKTRLALEAASTLVPSFKAGVFWVGLAALRDPALVIEQIAQTLGAKDGLAEHIAERELLLLLDNLEQVIEAAPELAALLKHCPNLTLLCTSRELLRVQGEVEYPVPPLASPEAVSLFCERSQTEPTEEIAELCARLDNLPLAVELAAARTKALTPAQILERLASRLDLLKGGRDADPRQQTLRATIAWSHDLLSQEEQALFRRFSVFAGGCTLEAAEEVADADLDTLQSLVEKSLLRFSDERYWMLETIREYAGERLERSGERGEIRDRHLEVTAASVFELGDASRNHEPFAFEMLRQERDNVRQALSWALETERADPAQRLLMGTWYHWLIGAAAEGDDWAARVVALPSDANGRYAECLAIAGEFARMGGDPARALPLKERAMRIRESLGTSDPENLRSLASDLSDLSEVLSRLGKYELAAEHAARALEIRRDHLGGLHEFHALSGLAVVEFRRQRLESAAHLYQAAAAAADSEGRPVDAAIARVSQADVLRRLGRLERARVLLTESMPVLRASGHQHVWANALAYRAMLAAEQEEHEAAVRLLVEATELVRTTGLVFEDFSHNEISATLEQCQLTLGEERYAAAVAEGIAAAAEFGKGE